MWERESARTDAIDPNSLNQRNAAAAAELYTELEPNNMRLVRIHAGQIKCSLLVGPESGAPNYESLSYEWGSTDQPETILFDGREYLITKNLFRILTTIRDWDSDSDDHILWIDALVIDQSDLKERATEVTKMLPMYSRAESTLAWIGDLDPTPPVRISSCSGFDIGLPSYPKPSTTETMSEEDKEKYEQITLLVQTILSTEYFRRAWVAQELMYSDDVIMNFDTVYLNMKDFLRLADFDDLYCEAYAARTSVVDDR